MLYLDKALCECGFQVKKVVHYSNGTQESLVIYILLCVPEGSCTMHTASCHKWRAFLCTNVNGCACKECVCMHVVWCENACMTKRKGKDVQQHSVDFANPATHTTAARNPAVFFGSPCIKSSQHYQYYLTQSDCTLGLQN